MAIWNERIHSRRIEKGITLAKVADRLGVTETTAQRYESGSIKNIPYEHICTYAEILKCSPSYLMGWDDKLYEDAVLLGAAITFDDIRIQELVKKFSSLTDAGRKKNYRIYRNAFQDT